MEFDMKYNLQRFIDAQDQDYETALSEIKNGRKCTHWIWYVFPQLKGLGHSYNSTYFGILNIEEANEYFQHPILGKRLIEITEALLEHSNKTADEILTHIDAVKVNSCMTLFWIATSNQLFKNVIDIFYSGECDKITIKKIEDNQK